MDGHDGGRVCASSGRKNVCEPRGAWLRMTRLGLGGLSAKISLRH